MIKKIATGLAAASILFASAVPAFAGENWNGHGGNIRLVRKCLQKVKQSNLTVADVDVTSIANTGENKIKNTTGGDATINSGDATSDVSVGVTGGHNFADVSDCCCGGCCGGCCDQNHEEVVVSENGWDSHNNVAVKDVSVSKVSQSNATVADVDVTSVANTGGNKIVGSTHWDGDGEDSIDTGIATSTVEVNVEGGHNVIL